eukprot:1797430-Prorocentrum_lima.AAC.1
MEAEPTPIRQQSKRRTRRRTRRCRRHRDRRRGRRGGSGLVGVRQRRPDASRAAPLLGPPPQVSRHCQ